MGTNNEARLTLADTVEAANRRLWSIEVEARDLTDGEPFALLRRRLTDVGWTPGRSGIASPRTRPSLSGSSTTPSAPRWRPPGGAGP